MIRLGGCPSWSESSLGAQIILLVLSCSGSLIKFKQTSKMLWWCYDEIALWNAQLHLPEQRSRSEAFLQHWCTSPEDSIYQIQTVLLMVCKKLTWFLGWMQGWMWMDAYMKKWTKYGKSLRYGPCHEKTCLCHVQTTKAQISLRMPK